MRRHDEDKMIGSADAALNLLPPVLSVFDVVPIDPGIEALRFERHKQALDKGFVLARIGDENIGHEAACTGFQDNRDSTLFATGLPSDAKSRLCVHLPESCGTG